MINFKAVDYLLYLLIRDKMSACGNGFIQNIYTIQIIECIFPSTQCQPFIRVAYGLLNVYFPLLNVNHMQLLCL